MLETLIGAVTEAVFGYVLEQAGLGEKTRALLKHDPQRLAFQVALTRTYATFSEKHPQWTSALFDQHFLTHAAAPLLARCLLRSNPPTGAELAATWADHLALSEETRTRRLPEATRVAADFLATLDKELRDRDEFQSLFDSLALDTTADATMQTAQSTAEIAQLLRTLLEQVEREHPPDWQKINNSIPNHNHQPLITSPTAKHTTNPSFPADTNPFVPGPIRYPEHFYGRKEQLAAVKACIGGVEPTCVSIIGMKYSGKSSLLFYIRERINIFCNQEQNPIAVYINFRNKSYWSLTGLIEGLRRGIKDRTGLEFWKPSQSSDHWSFYSGLEQLYSKGHRLIILIDEFEAVKHRLEDFQGWGEDWHAKATEKLLTMVLASQRPLRDLYASCGLVSPFDNIFTETRLVLQREFPMVS